MQSPVARHESVRPAELAHCTQVRLLPLSPTAATTAAADRSHFLAPSRVGALSLTTTALVVRVLLHVLCKPAVLVVSVVVVRVKAARIAMKELVLLLLKLRRVVHFEKAGVVEYLRHAVELPQGIALDLLKLHLGRQGRAAVDWLMS